MNLTDLKNHVKSAAAFRYRARLQPAGGAGDKVFPPTYEGGKYAEEVRHIEGERVPCVHLDSVQSQANRLEEALLEATRAGKFALPRVEVDFRAKAGELQKAATPGSEEWNALEDLKTVGVISSLEAPHRLADAILRDSRDITGKRFRETTEGKFLDSASLKNASGLFEADPTSLIFGLWDSTGPKGGLGVKFQRSIVSELVAIDTEKGVKSASRLDPLAIEKEAGVGAIFQSVEGSWTLDVAQAKLNNKKPLLVGKEGKPSEINHGNVTPSLSVTGGGVTFAYALQTTVISLPAIRRLQFPVAGKEASATNLAGQTTLVALGLAAAVLSISKGISLRSRCDLVPEVAGTWEILKADGQIVSIALTPDEACELLNAAVKEAEQAGLKWRKDPLTLFPSDGLTQLVMKSRALASKTKAEG